MILRNNKPRLTPQSSVEHLSRWLDFLRRKGNNFSPFDDCNCLLWNCWRRRLENISMKGFSMKSTGNYLLDFLDWFRGLWRGGFAFVWREGNGRTVIWTDRHSKFMIYMLKTCIWRSWGRTRVVRRRVRWWLGGRWWFVRGRRRIVRVFIGSVDDRLNFTLAAKSYDDD